MSAMHEIVACAPDDERFLNLPALIYGASALQFANETETDTDRLRVCLLALNNGVAVGRVAVYYNEAMSWQDRKVVQAGSFECLNNEQTAQALLDAVVHRSRGLGANCVIGPMDGSTWNQYRFKSAGGSAPFFTEQVHPAYYPLLWEAAGFTQFQEYTSNEAAIEAIDVRAGTFPEENGLIFRGIDPDNLEDELAALYPLCIRAFAGNPLFTPISREKFIAKLNPLKPLLDGRFTRLAVNGAGSPVAFILCLPDLFDKDAKRLIVKTAARHPECTVKGVISVLFQSILAEAYASGYRSIIHAFIHSGNRSLLRSRDFGGTEIRKYSLYIRSC